ncbi:MAG: hypothetical protein JJLCMIEE_02483 [Acidimicrobiales bacterium]|nr:hypothetical protein [Acidimicrobiales bacterium]
MIDSSQHPVTEVRGGERAVDGYRQCFLGDPAATELFDSFGSSLGLR